MSFRARRRGSSFELVGDEAASVTDANRFLEALTVRGLSPHTVRAYAYDLVVIHRWLAEAGLEVEALGEPDLIGLVKVQRDVDAQPTTINRRLTVCRLFHRFCTGHELGMGAGSVAPGPHYRGRGRDRWLGLHQLHPRARRLSVKVAHRVVDPLTPEEVRAFLRTLHRYRDIAIVHLMLLCGLRSREVLAIELADLDLNEGRLRARGKGNRERALPLPELGLATIRDYLRVERPRCKSTRLFVVLQGAGRGQPMTAAGLRSLFRHRRGRGPLARANPHRFRHTFGADMARSGMRLPILQRLMGHADSRTTLAYINLSMTDIALEYRRAVDAIKRRYGKA
jgi:site-specific recombinase XerD